MGAEQLLMQPFFCDQGQGGTVEHRYPTLPVLQAIRCRKLIRVLPTPFLHKPVFLTPAPCCTGTPVTDLHQAAGRAGHPPRAGV